MSGSGLIRFLFRGLYCGVDRGNSKDFSSLSRDDIRYKIKSLGWFSTATSTITYDWSESELSNIVSRLIFCQRNPFYEVFRFKKIQTLACLTGLVESKDLHTMAMSFGLLLITRRRYFFQNVLRC